MCGRRSGLPLDRGTTIAISRPVFRASGRVIVRAITAPGKSKHIEQGGVAAEWHGVRVNIDSHISRIDLIGKERDVIKEGLQITNSRRHADLMPTSTCRASAFENTMPADRTVMFVIQRVLEY